MRNFALAFVEPEILEPIGSTKPANESVNELAQFAGVERGTIEEHWPAIIEHKWFMSERLGRDVGTSVAGLDYFLNINPVQARGELRWKERLLKFITRPLASLSRWENVDSPASLVNFEQAMRGTRSLAK